MEIPVEKITDEQAANVLGAVAAATIPDPPKKKSCIIRLPNRSASTVTSAPEADLEQYPNGLNWRGDSRIG